MTYYLSDSFIPHHIPTFLELENPDTAIRNRLLDMNNGVEHHINMLKTKRYIVPYQPKGHWEVMGLEVVDIDITPDQKFKDCPCSKLTISAKLHILPDPDIHKRIYFLCNVPIIEKYIKNPTYLGFLHFYNPEFNRKPFVFVLNSQIHTETISSTIEDITFKEMEVEPDFFSCFLNVPEKN